VRRRARPSRRPAEPRAAAAGPRPPGTSTGGELERILFAAAGALGLTLPPAFPAQIATYLEELEHWERIGAMTAYPDRGARVRHLVVESLMLLAALPEPAAPLLDIGTGPGVPGLILKLARPAWEVVLIEAARRRANFLRHVARQLDLVNLGVEWGRAEALGSGALAGRFRTVTMRAVAAGLAAEALAAPFLHPDGVLAVSLGPTAAARRGTRRRITLTLPGELPWQREFLIIRSTELDPDVSRGTRRATDPQHRGREPEGRRRKDDDGR
jgi:16S rRNA (guanine527-N7)-methyltransferase